MAHWERCVESGTNYEAEYRLRSKDGTFRWFRARAVPIRDDQDNIVRWYGSCSDIHDSKLLEQAMRDSAAEAGKDGRGSHCGPSAAFGALDDDAGSRAPPYRS